MNPYSALVLLYVVYSVVNQPKMNVVCGLVLACVVCSMFVFAADPCQSNLEAAAQRGYNRTELLISLMNTFDIHNEGFVRMETVYLANEKLLNEAQRRLARISPDDIKRDCANADGRLYLEEILANECKCFNEFQLMAQAKILINLAKSRSEWWLTK